MSVPHTFHEKLLEARVNADQTVDAMSILLGLSPEDYEKLEGGKYPDDDTLRRLCKIMGWNYYEAQRLIINEMISPQAKPPLSARTSEIQAKSPQPGFRPVGAGSGAATPALASPHPHPPVRAASDTLSGRLRETRERMNQSKEIVALLLNIPPEEYARIEQGQSPSDEVLRRISLVFNWNYLELVDLARSQQAHAFQPRMPAPAFRGSMAHNGRLTQIHHEIVSLFPKLALSDQQTVLAQLELVRDTMRRHQVRHADPDEARTGS
jgi:transcriptional regulator with XRE-family HTH domain